MSFLRRQESTMKNYFVYVVTNKSRKVIYIGVTNNLSRRMTEHQLGVVKGFSQKYNLKYLIYFESYNSIEYAIIREKRIKKWKRSWKLRLIKSVNPELKDLCHEIPY